MYFYYSFFNHLANNALYAIPKTTNDIPITNRLFSSPSIKTTPAIKKQIAGTINKNPFFNIHTPALVSIKHNISKLFDISHFFIILLILWNTFVTIFSNPTILPGCFTTTRANKCKLFYWFKNIIHRFAKINRIDRKPEDKVLGYD